MNHDENHAEAIASFHSRLASVHEALSNSGSQDELHEQCLGIEATIALNIQLSTGGPGDGFEIICNAATGQPLHGCHYFTNWGFRREFPLSLDELAEVCAAYGLDDARLHVGHDATR